MTGPDEVISTRKPWIRKYWNVLEYIGIGIPKTTKSRK